MEKNSIHHPGEELINERKEKFLQFIKKDTNVISYVILAIITFISIRIRTANLAGLRDVTTGDWTLGPDLDPFLFLRWAKYIVENGSLMVHDIMRYAPLGYDTSYELKLHVYLIHWFHELASVFGSSSITQSAVLYPVFMFALSVIVFFFMTKKLCLSSMGNTVSNAIALIASFFLAVMPALLPRTIAGIPEKEASGLLFLFLAFYLFMLAWESSSALKRYMYGALAGISTAVMGLVWGGYLYILLTIGPLVLLAFILGKMDRSKKYLYLVWVATTFLLLIIGTKRYSITELLTSTTTLPTVLAVVLILVDLILFETPLNRMIKGSLARIPRPVLSLGVAVILGVLLTSLLFGPGLIVEKVLSLKRFLITTGVDRVSVTVAENRQPYFIEWASSFGPLISKIYITFWLLFAGAITLLYRAISHFKTKDRLIVSGAFAAFLLSIIFTRYSGSSIFNGTSGISLFFYGLGPALFLFVFGYYYNSYHKNGEQDKLSSIDFGSLFILSFFFLSLVSARGSVRLIMMLVPVASILTAYVAVALGKKTWESKDSSSKNYWFIGSGIVLIALLFAGYQFYSISLVTAQSYVPGPYNQQWQKAMAWVRESTSEDAVFGHWWDYGYWVQGIGERATVLDGGNAKAYWNHLMGRYALTGKSNKDALEFLYAHNTTHFLIDSTDIGKYNAFASIGSDQNYDRSSYIGSMHQDPSQTRDLKNVTVFVYTGGIPLDEDLVYDDNGTRVFLPAGRAALGAVIIEKPSSGGDVISQPQGIFVYQNKQYKFPLQYLYDGKLTDFSTGVEASIVLMPRLVTSGNNIQVLEDGSLLYLSSRVATTQFARLYLYNEENPSFNLVHSEDDFLVSQLKQQVPGFNSDFVYFDTIRGPIKIWEINYPSDIVLKEEYLSEEWPPELFRA